jgi:site-specific recombinase XerD
MTKRFRPHIKTLQSFQSGPLGTHLERFASLLIQKGYSSEAGWDKIRLVADLSRWMVQKNVRLGELDEKRTTTFLGWRWKRVAHQTGDQCTLALLLRQLRQEGIVPAPVAPAPSHIDLIEDDYERFLQQERGLMSNTIEGYLRVARRFLSERFEKDEIRLKELCTKDVTDFVVQDASTRGRRAAQLMASVMRSFLNYLFQEGKTTTNLAMAIPAMAGGRLSELPRYLERAQVEKLLRCCDRRRKVGRRDYSILLLLARLGLRASEVAGLELEDFDWTAGELLIRGKGNRVDRLPLLQDVGKAIADYLRNGRPSCSSRRVFVQCNAPFAGFSSPPNAVSGLVGRALARAGIKSRHQGAHLLRHSLATSMLRGGASLAQIGQVLRHESPQTTEIYAKVDLSALRALAQPWPGGAQ